MGIEETFTFQDKTHTKLRFEGCVLQIRKSVGRRNHSDTLDYSDWRETECTYALVYLGADHRGERCTRHEDCRADPELADACSASTERYVKDRFAWVDCTNLFSWRGAPHRVPTVDEAAMSDPVILADLAAWRDWEAERAEQARIDHLFHMEPYRVAEKQERVKVETRKAVEPLMGHRARVVRGRAVPRGTEGVVFWKGTTRYGERLGLHVDGQKEPVWVAARNCERVADGEAERTEQARVDHLSLGHRVRVVRGRAGHGTEGVVFWKGTTRYGERLGLRIDGQKEPVWVNASDCEQVAEPARRAS